MALTCRHSTLGGLLSLSILGLAVAACDRPAGAGTGGASSDAAAAATESAATQGPSDVEEAPSGPLPPRLSDLMVTEFEPEVIGNIYASDFEDLILDRWDAGGAAGRYARGQGYFEGVREPGSGGPDGIDRIEGYWRQAGGEIRCDTAREGTHYWGRLQFNFVHDRQSFIGFWGHCDGTALDRWNGKFVRRDAGTARAVAERLAAE